MAEVHVQMNFRYLDNGEEGSIQFSIPSDTQTLWDLKLLIQENINSPACDLKVFFQGQQLQDPSLLLNNLYFRDRDLVKVEAPAKIDIQSLRKVIAELKKFKERIEKGENSFEDCKSEEELELVYSVVEHSLSIITDQFFAPWNTKKAATNRHFFVQDGGFSALMVLLRYSQQQPCGFRFSGEQKTRRLFITRSKIKRTFRNHLQLQLKLQAECLSLLWRFMVRAADRKYVVENGGVEVILFGLMLSPEAHLRTGSTSDERLGMMLSWKTIMVNQQALGCLAGCVEYDKHAQEIVANDKAAVDKLLDMMCKNSRDHFFYRLFFSLVAANTLFYVTFSSQALKKLTDDQVYLKIIPLAEKFLNASDVRVRVDPETNLHDDSLHLGYYLCLILARMLASPLVTIDASTASTVNSLINSCMEKVTPTAIARLEERQSYVWVTLIPLVHLAFAGGLETLPTEGVFSEEVVMATETPVSQTALDREQPLLVQNCCATPAFPGSQVVQRLGLFAMQHLLYSTANRQLLLQEDLLQYLVCLSWQLQVEEKHELRRELNKFDDVKPPSLKAAAKSVLARLHGFEVIFKSY